MKTEYWTVWGGADHVCSKHRTSQQAEKAAQRCEADGGAPHRVYKVQQVKRRKVK